MKFISNTIKFIIGVTSSPYRSLIKKISRSKFRNWIEHFFLSLENPQVRISLFLFRCIPTYKDFSFVNCICIFQIRMFYYSSVFRQNNKFHINLVELNLIKNYSQIKLSLKSPKDLKILNMWIIMQIVTKLIV